MKKHLNAGNMISLLRIPLGLLLFYGIVQENILTAFLAFLLGVVTDVLDGYIARKYNHETKFGAILDPVCDKFFVIMGIIAVFYLRIVPYGFLVLFFSRELIQLVMLAYMKILHATMSDWKAIWSSKITTALQYITIMWLFLEWNYSEVLFLAIGVLGIISGIKYFQRLVHLPR